MRRRRPLLLLLPVLVVACARSAPPPAPTDAAVPSFAPAPELTAAPTPVPDATAPSPAGTSPAGTSPAATDEPVPMPSPQPSPVGTAEPAGDAPPDADGPGANRTGTITDTGGDVRAGTPLQEPPEHVDLRRVTLTRGADGYEVRAELAADAPARRDGDRITNVATFYDVDGDGALDYQVYATSTPDGWGSAYFDHVEGSSAYADEDEVEVRVEAGVLVLRFPLGHLGHAERLQWSAATQWGTLGELQTGTEARDRAPDDGRGVVWPQDPGGPQGAGAASNQ